MKEKKMNEYKEADAWVVQQERNAMTLLDGHLRDLATESTKTIRKALQQALVSAEGVVHVTGDIDLSNFDMSAGIIIPEPVKQWRPISEAPKTCSNVLLYRPNSIPIVGYYGGTVFHESSDGVSLSEQPTKWMPLPPVDTPTS